MSEEILEKEHHHSDKGQEQAFGAEVSRLLEMMVHSVYSDKDIFLRELISNASDACEKLRFESQVKPELKQGEDNFQIHVVIDNDAGTLTIEDNGIGMNEQDLKENLGTIARSGTKAFMDAAKGNEDKKSSANAFIGQFGVGFYSVFMVAKWVEVTSSKAGEDKAFVWTSDGKGSFRVMEMEEGEQIPHGTSVTLHLKDDAKKYLDVLTLEGILRSYSQHIPIPVKLAKMSGVNEEAEDPIEIGDGTALWRKPKNEITPEEYAEFFQMQGGMFGEPAKTIHYHAEGRHEYHVLTFLPKDKPFDLFDPERRGKLKLYVRRVFISDETAILPSWLRFVRGVVDSEDLPLNISRELLQESPILDAIKKGVTKRIVSEINKLAKTEPDIFNEFWQNFGAVIKEGLYEDPMSRDEIFEISRFKTSKSGGEWITLKDYVERIKDNQTEIYFATGDSEEAILKSPQLEGFIAKDIEVLLLSDPVDNFWTSTALGFEGKPFKSVTQGAADLTKIKDRNTDKDVEEEDKSEEKALQSAEIAQLIEFLKENLSEHVRDVQISERLSKSPACLIAPNMGPDRRLERMLAQAQGNTLSKPVFEINADHALVLKMSALYKNGEKEKAGELGQLLFDQACILDGERPVDVNAFAERLTKLMCS